MGYVVLSAPNHFLPNDIVPYKCWYQRCQTLAQEQEDDCLGLKRSQLRGRLYPPLTSGYALLNYTVLLLQVLSPP